MRPNGGCPPPTRSVRSIHVAGGRHAASEVRDPDQAERRRKHALLPRRGMPPPARRGAGHAELFRPDELSTCSQRAEVFVAEARGEVAGYVAVERDDDALTVRCLCVDPAFEAAPSRTSSSTGSKVSAISSTRGDSRR